jgi:hypothetical protein
VLKWKTNREAPVPDLKEEHPNPRLAPAQQPREEEGRRPPPRSPTAEGAAPRRDGTDQAGEQR